MVALYTVLSQHAPNEHYLSDADQGLVYVRPPDSALFANLSVEGLCEQPCAAAWGGGSYAASAVTVDHAPWQRHALGE